MQQTLFYILAAATVICTLCAITRRHPVHAIVFLVTSFFALAVIFFLLSAPLVAVFEVILYAGAVMVLFMFVIMMLDLGHPALPGRGTWLAAICLAGIILIAILGILTVRSAPAATAGIGIKEFAVALFHRYGIAVEIISMQLLFAVVGALYLGRKQP